ncbi:hypothetical protein GA0115246_103546 [Streptomyces sp. SolWspMP-sol7th]|nr:hypothetical protein GA0115246_103546 [Streptomyces sp. SolWspMP-sol7th]
MPTYRSLRARAEPSTSRQTRAVTVVSHAPGARTAARRAGASPYQRAYASCTASSASVSEPSKR